MKIPTLLQCKKHFRTVIISKKPLFLTCWIVDFIRKGSVSIQTQVQRFKSIVCLVYQKTSKIVLLLQQHQHQICCHHWPRRLQRHKRKTRNQRTEPSDPSVSKMVNHRYKNTSQVITKLMHLVPYCNIEENVLCISSNLQLPVLPTYAGQQSRVYIDCDKFLLLKSKTFFKN